MTNRPRLLLVYPSTHKLGWVRRFQLPSLSLKLVAASTPPEWDIVLADELHEDIPFEGEFDAVGITAMTHQAVRAYEVADRFRSRGIPVILGGMHATVLPDEALRHADAVVIGEAEPVWAGLLTDLLTGRLAPNYSSVPGNETLVIPWARRDILAGKKYLTTQTLQASRGCPYDCPFCTVTPYFGSSFRYRDPEDILAEMRTFDRKLTVILDDNILGDPERARPILKGMAGLGLRWGGQANLRFAEDPEMVRLLAESGCIGIFVGLESVNGAQANHPKTGSRYSQADLIKRVRDAGIVLEASMIFGFDDHDEGVFETTIRYLELCRPSIPTLHILTPYPGTALFRQFDGEGRLLHKDWQRYDHNQVVFRPKLMSPERLYRGWVDARREVYRWPSIFARVMAGRSSYFTNLAYNCLRRGGVYGEEMDSHHPHGPEVPQQVEVDNLRGVS
jgi:radical SAM superfamily enzyme YgiQ (UPF0313 family)